MQEDRLRALKKQRVAEEKEFVVACIGREVVLEQYVRLAGSHQASATSFIYKSGAEGTMVLGEDSTEEMKQILSILAYGKCEQTSIMVKRSMDYKTHTLEVLTTMVALNLVTDDSDTKLYTGPQVLWDTFALQKCN